jgi:hypothetical protein
MDFKDRKKLLAIAIILACYNPQPFLMVPTGPYVSGRGRVQAGLLEVSEELLVKS